MVILAISSLVLAGVLGYQRLNQSMTSQPVVSQPQINQPSVGQGQLNQDETTGLKTYKNEKYGFEFQYQYPEFFISYVNEREDTLHFQIVMHTKDYNGMGQGASLTIGVYDNGDIHDCSERTGRYVMIDNKRHEKCLSILEGGSVQGLWITIKNGNFDYSFELDDTDVFDQMLSTFKFTK